MVQLLKAIKLSAFFEIRGIFPEHEVKVLAVSKDKSNMIVFLKDLIVLLPPKCNTYSQLYNIRVQTIQINLVKFWTGSPFVLS